MPSQPQMKLIQANECLLTDVFLDVRQNLGEPELANSLFVFPTQRLATVFLSQLAQEEVAVLSPKVTTIENLVDLVMESRVFECRQANAEDLNQPQADPLYCELLLTSLIETGNFENIGLNHAHEVHQLFTDVEELSERSPWLKLEDYVADMNFRKESYQELLLGRLRELSRLHVRFHEMLEKAGLGFRAANQKLKAEKALGCTASFLEQYDHIYIVGLTTVKKFLLPLLHEFSKNNKVRFFLTHPFTTYSKISPLSDLVEVLDQSFAGPAALDFYGDSKLIELRKCSNPVEEVFRCVQAIRDDINQGIAESHIAILVPDEATYAPLLKAAFEDPGLQANIALATPLSSTAVGTWLQAFSAFTSRKGELSDAISFMVHPITVARLQSEGIFRYQEVAKLYVQLKQLSTKYQSIGDMLADSDPIIQQSDEVKILQFLCQQTRLFSELKPSAKIALSRWDEMLQDLFEVFSVRSYRQGGADGEHESQNDAIRLLQNQLGLITKGIFSFFTPSEFWKLLKDRILNLEVRSVGYPLEGVQIVNFVESRYVPFKKAYVLGCVEGKIPRSLPQDHLVSDAMKRYLGLKGWAYVESLEDTTFFLLASRLERLVLLWPEKLDGSPQVKSRMLEQLVVHGYAKELHFGTPSFSCFLSDEPSNQRSLIEQGAASSIPFKVLPGTASFGKFETLNALAMLQSNFSATSLKSLFDCPFKFALSKIKIKPGLRQWEGAAQAEGTFLHEVLEHFFNGFSEKASAILIKKTLDRSFGAEEINTENVTEFLRDSLALPLHQCLAASKGRSNLSRLLCARIHLITDQLNQRDRQSPAFLHHLVFYAWPRLVDFLLNAGLGEMSSVNFESEVSFSFQVQEMQIAVQLSNGELFQLIPTFVGSMDQLVTVGKDRLILDFKRKTLPAKKDVQQGDNPQLPIYAWATSHLKGGDYLEKMILGYYSVLSGKFAPVAFGSDVEEHLKSKFALKATKNQKGVSTLVEELSKKFGSVIVDLVEANEFIANPGDACRVCDYAGICRVAAP